MHLNTATVWETKRGNPEPSLQEPFIDYGDSDFQEVPECARARDKENVMPPEATAPPLDTEDDELEAFGKSRANARDAMIQVEGIPKMYILVDFGKWGSPKYREMLCKTNI